MSKMQRITPCATRRTARSLLVAAILLLQVGPARAADRSFPCLSGAAGKTLRWSAAWQNDRQDDEHHYQIQDILHFETNSSYSVVISLVGDASAAKPERHLAIASAASAQAVCERLAKSAGTIPVPTVSSGAGSSAPGLLGTGLSGTARPSTAALSRTARAEEEQPRREPQFIRYLRHGWVRADLPRAQMPLSTCEIMGRQFLCLEEEKERFGEQLGLVAEQIEAQPSLRH